ncbi:MASE1 domain-containing protein [Massilia oculi]|uniref:histidine kinase n=1 Tax=Massilia hydrophila TaxID=3044279 RepID=A0ABS7Y6K1_9BURK|nr:ATP-binding protein [Massilia oculi]MCA1855302.1 MASE1 domain-containing protein [Massilia oculi]
MFDLRAIRAAWLGGAFCLAYVVLDATSGPEARHQTIAPVWHPAAGLALFLVLRCARQAALPVLLAALLAAAITPALPERPAFSLLIGLLPPAIYLAVGTAMRRHLPGSAFHASHQGLLLWAVFATMGSLGGAVAYATVLHGPEAFATRGWLDVVARYAIAETAGMLVVVPICQFLLDGELRAAYLGRILRRETAAYIALMAAVLAVALQRPAPESLVYYLLILPLAWSAARQGMAGAVTSALVLEIGVTVASLRPIAYAAQMPDVQMLVLTLTLSGFLIGIAVDVARRASHELRHSLRLAAAGEMAGAVAHELNQPLTALSMYGSACERLLARGDSEELLQKTIRAMVAESQRASEVLKRLREFFRTGTTALAPVALPALVGDMLASFADQAAREGVHLETGPLPDACVLGDRVQLEIVLRNLLSNAIHAVASMPAGIERRIAVEAGVEAESVWIRIADNGPGIADKIRARLFEPFISLKSSGLGLGLAISRAIIETHGGALSVEPGRHAILKITLPAHSGAGERTT